MGVEKSTKSTPLKLWIANYLTKLTINSLKKYFQNWTNNFVNLCPISTNLLLPPSLWLPTPQPHPLPASAWIPARFGRGRKREEQRIIKIKMEAAKINRVKGIKKTFLCEADQSRSELRKNHQKTNTCFVSLWEGKKNHPMLHVVFVLLKLMTVCQCTYCPIICSLGPFLSIYILPNSPAT